MPGVSAEDARLWRSWRQAAGEPAIDEAIRALYAELDDAVAAKGPTCWVSGRCCKFDSFGHRLYVTGLEIAWFLAQAPPLAEVGQTQTSGTGGLPILMNAPFADACPYQTGGLCGAHATRPLGCRIFFCQRGTETWQQDLYERFLEQLRRLHDGHGLPYRYMEWRAGLREAAAAEDGLIQSR